MPLTDYTEIVEKLQKALGRGFAEEPWILNVPGKSIACKSTSLLSSVFPAFSEQLARLGGMFPDQVNKALVKTGNFITKHLNAIRFCR